MPEKKTTDRIMVAIIDCVNESSGSAEQREAIANYLNRLRRRGWSESDVGQVEENVRRMLGRTIEPTS